MGRRGRTTPAGDGKHRVSEIGMGVSCSGSGEKGRRTELELGRSKSFEDHHGAATFGDSAKEGAVPWLPMLVVLTCDGGTASSSRKQSGRRAVRRRLARKPKWRMRTKPLGSVCNRKRRRNSSSARVINLCSLL